MKIRQPYQLPDEQQEKMRRAKRLEWTTIGFMTSIILLMYFVMGSSQAMYSAWVEDCLSLVPPIAFLVAVRFRKKEPDEKFPYGYRRAMSIAFLVAAVALTALGLYLLIDAAISLINAEHPTIGIIEIFGWRVWLGWLMIAALVYSAIPPVVLGRMKLQPAKDLHEKVLYTDAEMNKADWMTALAGILGIVGIGIGWWWADSAAAAIISFDILKDGFTNLKTSVFDLMDKEPTKVDKDEADPLIKELERELQNLEWVSDAQVRLREEGDVYCGEAYVVPKNETNLLENVERATDLANDFSWRIYDVVVTPVKTLKRE